MWGGVTVGEAKGRFPTEFVKRPQFLGLEVVETYQTQRHSGKISLLRQGSNQEQIRAGGT